MKENYTSVYDVKLDQIKALGGTGDKNKYDSVYQEELEMLRLLEEGGGSGGGLKPEDLKTINGESIVGEGDIEIQGGGKEVELVRDGFISADDYAGIMELSIKPYTMNSTYGKMYGTVLPSKGQVHFNWISAKNSYTQLSTTIAYFTFTWSGGQYQCKWNSKLSATFDPLTKDQFATINGQSITNGGNIEIQGGSGDSTFYLELVDGNYTEDVASFYNYCIENGKVGPIQIIEYDDEQTPSYYIPSSSRMYNEYVELWLMYTEDGATWTLKYYKIDASSITITESEGRFGA